jgi:K+-transporting ATPase A subunit
VNAHAWLLLGVYLSILLAAAAPLGSYLARVMDSDSSFALRMGRPLEMLIYRLSGVRADEQMGWLRYALAILIFNAVGVLAVYALQRLQAHLPLNLEALPAVSADSSFNTAVSFVTNTNWQGYGGEATMSYLTQMVGLAVQNFLSAATGIVVAIALIRGFARRSSATIGNAWVDLTRVTLYVLLPLCVIYAVFLVSQGVVQNFDAYRQATTLDTTHYTRSLADADGQARIDTRGAALTEAVTTRSQTLPMGPIASQESIKMLGTNGGGFLNANSAHPFENPTPLSNFIQMLSIFLIPAALCLCFGVMVGDKRQGWAVLAAMTLMFVVMAVAAITFEQQGNPLLAGLGVEHTVGNMEGKETRFGIADSGLFATITTLASCGAVNAMHDSFTPLGGLVPLGNMMLGEVVFGGVGTGPVRHAGVRGDGGVHRRPHDRAYARIPRQEDRGLRNEDGVARGPGHAAGGAGGHGARRVGQRRRGECGQPGRPWLFGDPVRLHLGRQQQRQRLRGTVGEHAVLQPRAWYRHVARTLWRHRAGAGDGRRAGRQEAARGQRRHHANPRSAVRGAADRYGGVDRRAELRAGAGPRAGGRTFDAVGQALSQENNDAPSHPRAV